MFSIGPHSFAGRVALAPMSGISDLPFRRAAARAGAPMVVSEMVASDALVAERPDVVLRAAMDEGNGPQVIQLAGREAKWMALGAEIATARGADIIDINMGCPARQVTGGLSGSALMRDPGHAMTLIEATLGAAKGPVTVKMRLGWDHDSLNAPELARRAEAAGVAAVTVHGRTRQQFYTGRADWGAVARVVDAVSIPVIVNGDIADAAGARTALAQSGAAAVMVGRAAEGRPWLPGAIADALRRGGAMVIPPPAEQAGQLIRFYRQTLEHYAAGHRRGEVQGRRLGMRTARKHLAAYAAGLFPRGLPPDAEGHRAQMCRSESPSAVEDHVWALADLATALGPAVAA